MKEVYQVLGSMLGQESRISQIANNLANVNTVGFKSERVTFEDYLKKVEQAEATGKGVDPKAALADWSMSTPAWPISLIQSTDYTSGSLTATGHPLDMAIQGDGFFRVLSAEGGHLYTRAGNFTMDAKGKLITANGEPVLNDGGQEIHLDPTGGQPSVASDGTISQNGKSVATVGVATFSDTSVLKRLGNGCWQATDGVAPNMSKTATVRSGMLEESNVNMIHEMTAMIETQRAYEFNQRVIRTFDSLATKRIEAATS